MKKILFIIPPYFNADDYLNKDRAAVMPQFTIPYGILSMESYLTATCDSSIELQLLDLNVTLQKLVADKFAGDYICVFNEEIEKRLREFNPQFVGVSALFNSSNRYIQDILKTCKDYNSNIITLAEAAFLLRPTRYCLRIARSWMRSAKARANCRCATCWTPMSHGR